MVAIHQFALLGFKLARYSQTLEFPRCAAFASDATGFAAWASLRTDRVMRGDANAADERNAQTRGGQKQQRECARFVRL